MARDHLAHVEALEFEPGDQSELLLQLAVGNDDAALGVEHAKTVRHVVDRGIEALGEQRHVARRDHGIEQRAAQPIGDQLDRIKGRHQQRGEDPVKQIAVQHQRRRHRRPGAEDLHDDKARIGEVAAEDSRRIRDGHREADQIRERIVGAREREEAPETKQRQNSRRAGAVTEFPLAGDLRRGDASRARADRCASCSRARRRRRRRRSRNTG